MPVAILVRILGALLLVCLSLAAHAENYKCKLSDGSTTYQDTPCASLSGTQEVITNASGSVLISLVSEAAMVGWRASPRNA